MERYSLWGNASDKRQLTLSFEHHLLRGKRVPFGDWEIVANYEKPKVEARALARTVGVIDVSYFTFVRVTGSDAASVLDAHLTRDIKGMAQGEVRRALMLNDKGGVLLDLEVVAMENSFLLVAPPTLPADRVIHLLTRQLLVEDVEFHDVGESFVAISLLGEHRGWLARALGIEAPLNENVAIKPVVIGGWPAHLLRTSFFGGAFVLLVKVKQAAELWSDVVAAARELGGLPVGYEAMTSWRIERGLLWHGIDFDEECAPNEIGLQSAVTAGKMGYAGAAAIARAAAQPPERRLCGLILDTSQAPPNGTPLLSADGRPAGVLKSVGFSYRYNKFIAIGLVRYEDPMPSRPYVFQTDEESAEALPMPLPFPAPPGEEEED